MDSSKKNSRRLDRWVGTFLKIGTLLSVWGLIASVVLQIVCRFTPLDTPAWTEEASRLFFIYAVSFAAGLAMKSDYYVYLDAIYHSVGARAKRVLDMMVPIGSLAFFAVMAVYAVELIILGIPEKSPGMGFNMGVAFASMFVLPLFIVYYLWRGLQKLLKKDDR